ncbi:multidrug efflux SMR transporter [Conexibacter sp. JD483]|uniref:DMT family transporter n=1 Tax=unclassified Conexibacter TaxID=2627773 RepID=UPI00271819EF|nr:MULTISPECIES: multidrug efflux SMR transporter [unclassified Conexibacter]MDO8187297.1 multidrug efflux SMR transporter [Conexibacter sp. CPCC 205706]MDO8198906.1 multidrug efflux SMR transporter [Conexibacter sp. CPCC 205762]MDR9370645.1 multidrug efflux SMR transporter [Conexibacter sp. JD483]
MGYLFLAGAICAEIVATLSLRASEGFSKLPFAAVMAVGYVVTFTLLSMALERGVPLGVAYGIWSAIGVAAVAALSVPLFGESLSALQLGGIVLVIGGVVALEAGASH